MSNYKYLDDNGLIYYHSKVKALLNNKVDKVNGKGLSTNDYTTAEKNKLSGIASGAEVNQNAFSNVKVGSTTVAADAKTDTLELAAGTNITLTPDSTNDKVTIATSAQANVIESIKVNGTAQTITSKAVDITVPTKVSDLTNDSGFTTNTGTVTSISTSGAISGGTITTTGTITHSTSAGYKHIPAQGSSGQYLKYGGSSGTASWESPASSISSTSTNATIPGAKCVYDAIQDAISSITGINFEIVETLPSTGTTGTIYLVANSGTGTNSYDEYIWLASASKFEKIGTTDVDLSGYVQKTEMVAITNAEIDTIVA